MALTLPASKTKTVDLQNRRPRLPELQHDDQEKAKISRICQELQMKRTRWTPKLQEEQRKKLRILRRFVF
jgi:hypothetical protein